MALSLEAGLVALADDLPGGALQRLLRAMSKRLQAGESLETVMDRYGRHLPVHLRGLIAAGARTGSLAEALGQYVDHQQRSRELFWGIWLSLVYPLVLLLCSVGVFLFIAVAIIPQFKKIFADFGIELPGLTLMMIGLSDFMIRHGVLLAGVLVVIVVAIAGSGMLGLRCFLWTPLIGRACLWSALAELYRLLGMLLGRDIPLPAALEMLAEGSRRGWATKLVYQLRTRVQSGLPLAQALAEAVSPRLWPLFHWGQANQAVPEALSAAGEMLEGRVRAQAALLRTAVPPVLLALVIFLIASTVFAMYLPLLKLLHELGQ